MATCRLGCTAVGPRIYFFMGVRVLSDTDFAAVVRWAETAAQVVDAVGLYCYEPTTWIVHDVSGVDRVPTAYELERVLYRACTELQGLRTSPPPPIPHDVAASAAAQADKLTAEAATETDTSFSPVAPRSALVT